MSGVAIMIVVAVVFFVAAAAVLWYLFVRGSTQPTLEQKDFDEAYDELATKGEVGGGDRDAAWQDFRSWQEQNEADRRVWDEAADE